jgi:hypothetical protein
MASAGHHCVMRGNTVASDGSQLVQAAESPMEGRDRYIGVSKPPGLPITA